MEKLLIIGTGGHAKSALDCISLTKKYEVVGLIDDFIPFGEERHGIPVVGCVDDVALMVKESETPLKVHIAIGDNQARKKIFIRIGLDGELYANVIHPTAYISNIDVFIGSGVFIGAFAFINAGSSVSTFALINSHASVDHDCCIGYFSSLAPAATLAGTVNVGALTQLSMGVNVGPKVKIGSNCIIGGGSFVKNNVPDNTYGFGVPFKAIRNI